MITKLSSYRVVYHPHVGALRNVVMYSTELQPCIVALQMLRDKDIQAEIQQSVVLPPDIRKHVAVVWMSLDQIRMMESPHD